MNKTQIQTVLAPIIGVLATWLAAKVPLLDPATWNTLISAIAVAGVTAFIAFITRQKPLTNTVGNFAGTQVVAPPEIANALPANASVVPSNEAKVVSK